MGVEDYGVLHWTDRSIQQNVLLCCKCINIPCLARKIRSTANFQMVFTALAEEARFLC